MPFYARVNDAINRSHSALAQLAAYRTHEHPRAEPNNSIRNNARVTIYPVYAEVKQAVREGRYEGISGGNAREALQAAELLRRATFSLSEKAGRPANIFNARAEISRAVDLLQRSKSWW